MKDDLGTRMKEQYEFRAKYSLPRRTYTVLRLDGKNFHTWTKFNDCIRPFDKSLHHVMIETTKELCRQIQGSVLGYTQSDEISILLTDFNTIHTDAWFDGNIQKIVSVAASIATAEFNSCVIGASPALFDARCFTIPDPIEVYNYFVWRQKDATRNSISMLAQHHFSHKELQNKNKQHMMDMLMEKNINWNDLEQWERRGSLIMGGPEEEGAGWVRADTPIFSQSEWFKEIIPRYERVQ